VHFLVIGSKSYHKYYQLMLKHLKNGLKPEEAMNATFATADMEKMELVWKAYIKKLTAARSKPSFVF
jgi:hypothetical protein